MRVLFFLVSLTVTNLAYASCEDLDDKSMLRAALALQAATSQGYNMSTIFNVSQGCTLPNPKNLRCVFFTTERTPNTECPDQFPTMEAATIVCLMPDLSLDTIRQAHTACM